MGGFKEQLPIDPTLDGGDNLIRLIDYSYPNIASIINLEDYIFDNIQEHIIEPNVANTSIRVTATPRALFRGVKTLYYKRFNLADVDSQEWILDDIEDVPTTPEDALTFFVKAIGLVAEELTIEPVTRYMYRVSAIDNAYTVYADAIITIAPLDTRIPLDEVIEQLLLSGLNLPDTPPNVHLPDDVKGGLRGFLGIH